MSQPRLRLPYLPPRIEGLATLATNLWWSWSPDARMVFRKVDEDTVALTAASVPALTSHTIAGSPVFLWDTADPYYFSGLVYLGETTVGRVELSLKLPADYLIARFRLPACVLSGPDVNQAGHLSAIYWGRADWLAAAFVNGSANGLFGPAATIYAFSVFRGNMSPCPKTTAPWRGAAAWWRYTAWIEEQAD